MMSLFADDAVLTDTAHDNKVYRGKEQVRTYWADVSGPFRPEHHHWIGYTPAMRIISRVTGNTGTLELECLWMNADDNSMKINELNLERLSQGETPVAHVVAKWASDKRVLSQVYGAPFLLRAARARGRNLRSPRITYST